MKKLISLLLTCTMLLGCTVFAAAVDEGLPVAGTTDISVTVDRSIETYTLSIPATAIIDAETGTGTMEIALTDVTFHWNNGIIIYYGSANPDTESGKGAYLVNTANADQKVHYQITDQNLGISYGKNEENLAVDYDKTAASHPRQTNVLEFTVDGTYPAPGTYTDTLTFRAEIYPYPDL